MYTFAGVFLLKVATRYRAYVNVEPEQVFEVVERMVELFEMQGCARQHLVHGISGGLRAMLAKARLATATSSVCLAVGGEQDGNGIQQQVLDQGYGDVGTGPDRQQWPFGRVDGKESRCQQINLEYFDFLAPFPPTLGVGGMSL